MTINTTYKGSPFEVLDAPDAFVKTQVVSHMEKLLQPFEEEIQRSGGSVTIDFDDNNKTKLIYDIPEELEARIKRSFGKK
jgi:hypothetical protein